MLYFKARKSNTFYTDYSKQTIPNDVLFILKLNKEMSEYTSIPDSHELNRSNELSSTEDQLRLKRELVNAAVEVVGNDYQKIEEFLIKKYKA